MRTCLSSVCLIQCLHLNRYSCRALVIPFSHPSIGPECEEDGEAFASLAEKQKQACSAVGWVISLGKMFAEGGKGDVYSRLLPPVRDALPAIDLRLCTG